MTKAQLGYADVLGTEIDGPTARMERDSSVLKLHKILIVRQVCVLFIMHVGLNPELGGLTNILTIQLRVVLMVLTITVCTM